MCPAGMMEAGQLELYKKKNSVTMKTVQEVLPHGQHGAVDSRQLKLHIRYQDNLANNVSPHGTGFK